MIATPTTTKTPTITLASNHTIMKHNEVSGVALVYDNFHCTNNLDKNNNNNNHTKKNIKTNNTKNNNNSNNNTT